jgi:hypothetical protein
MLQYPCWVNRKGIKMTSQYNELFAEIESIQDAYQWGFLEALSFIARHKSEYGNTIQTQLDQFVRAGQEFFGEPA